MISPPKNSTENCRLGLEEDCLGAVGLQGGWGGGVWKEEVQVYCWALSIH